MLSSPRQTLRQAYHRTLHAGLVYPFQPAVLALQAQHLRIGRDDIEEIARLQSGIKLPPLTPANERGAAEDIGDRVLFPMMMYSCAGSRLNEEETSPHRRLYAGPSMDGSQAL